MDTRAVSSGMIILGVMNIRLNKRDDTLSKQKLFFATGGIATSAEYFM